LTQAGAGILFVEYTYVHKSGQSELNQMGIDSDSQIPAHKELASIIKKSGGLAGIQLVHGGGKSSSGLTGGKLLGASSVIVPTKGNDLEKPIEMTLKEIELYQNWYLEAAIRAAKSGYDIVELHSAHGYGLNQWLSPLTNQRTDEYGGTLINRSKMLCEIFHKIRVSLPHKILGVRIPGEDHFAGGLTKSEMFLVSQKLQDLGADFIDVSSGIGGWRRPEGRNGEGYLVEDASQIKHAISLPVIGVGGIENGNTIDQMLREECLDFAAVGRAILKNPEVWRKSHLYAEDLGAAI
jgi:NADPH2 dehydrogenase